MIWIFLKNKFSINILFLKYTESSVHQDTGPGYGWRCVRRNLGRYINLLFLPWEISDSTQFVGFKCAVPWYPYTKKHSLKKVIQGKEIVIKWRLRTAINYFLNLKFSMKSLIFETFVISMSLSSESILSGEKRLVTYPIQSVKLHYKNLSNMLLNIEQPTNKDKSCLPTLLIWSLNLKKCI